MRAAAAVRLMRHARDSGQMGLFNPAKPLQGQEPFLVLSEAEVFAQPDEAKSFPEMRATACRAFLALEKAWQLEGGTLVDLKVEFGYDPRGRLLLADVVDNDSWRVVETAAYIANQAYPTPGALADLAQQ